MAGFEDYCELSTAAHEAGGPKAYLQDIKENSFQEGILFERTKQLPMLCGVVLVAGGLVWGWTKLYDERKIRKIRKQFSERSEQTLLNGLKKVEVLNSDLCTEELKKQNIKEENEKMNREELQNEINELMRQYQDEEIDGDTYSTKMMELTTSIGAENL